MKKKLLKIVLIVVVFLGTVALVLALSGAFQGPVADGYIADRITPAVPTQQSGAAALEAGEEGPGETPSAQPADVAPSTDPVNEAASAEPSSGPGSGNQSPAKEPSNTPESANTPPPSPNPDQTISNAEVVEDEALPAGADWLEKRIEEHKAEIDPDDLDDFRTIIAKLDQAYIESLSLDGFTADEQDLLKSHMRSRLSDDEYDRAKVLFYKYNYLLEEE